MLGYSEAIDDHCLFSLRIDPGRFYYLFCRNSCYLGSPFRRIFLYNLPEFLESLSAAGNEVPLFQPFPEDDIHHSIQ